MTDLSGKTALAVDGGLFLELAIRLSKNGFGRVLYKCDITQPFPKVHESVVGDGFESIEVTSDIWAVKDEVDVFVFPDCSNPGLQRELRQQGKAVWGSGDGVFLEWNRRSFLERISELGLPVPEYEVVNGLANLRTHLHDLTDQYIKISRYRGNGETWHWIDRQTSFGELDRLAIEYGGVAENVQFLVFPSLECVSEWGYDGYFCGGRFPSHSMHGLECKDKSYIGAFVSQHDLPEQIRHVNEVMTPVLRECGYANFYSSEVRITEDGTGYFSDPTCRHASPAGEPQLEIYSNLPEIVWAGAHGECIDPIPTAKFSAQALITHHGDEKKWRRIIVPNPVRQWVKLYSACQTADEVYDLPPFEHSCESVGSVIGLGNTVSEALEDLKENASALEGQPVTVEIMSLADTLKDVVEAESAGVELSNGEVPEPASVLA